MSWEIYLGPYFECVRKPVEVVREQKFCPVKHPVRQPAEYCASCGAALIVRTSTTTTYESLFERVNEQLREMDGQSVSATAKVYLSPNVSRPGGVERVNWAGKVEQRVDIGAIDTSYECGWLERAFADECKILLANCASVETKWGFHRWWL